jgi:hypothetical protein
MANNAFEQTYNVAAKLLSDAGIDMSIKLLLTIILIAVSPLVALFLLAISQTPKKIPPPAGCRKLGLNGASNLEDQYSKRYAKGGDPTPAKPWTLKALFVYPIKSCAPIELEKCDIIRTGLKYDRQFTLAQQVTSLPSMDGKVTSEWHFMTQRKFPRLAKIETEIWVPDPSARDYKEDGEWVKSDGCLVVRFPFSPDTDFTRDGLLNWGKILAAKLARRSEPMLEFKLPFNPPKETIKSKKYRNEVLHIWKDSPVALNMTPEVDPEIFAKLRYTLGAANPIALFRINTNAYREVHKCAPKKENVGFETIIGMQDSVCSLFIQSLLCTFQHRHQLKRKNNNTTFDMYLSNNNCSIQSTLSTSPPYTTSPQNLPPPKTHPPHTSGKIASPWLTPYASAPISTSPAHPPLPRIAGKKLKSPILTCTSPAAQRAASYPTWTLILLKWIAMSR